MNPIVEETREHWQAIGPLLTIRNDQEYAAAVERLNALLDEVGEDEEHPVYGLLDILGTLVHAYEEEHVPIPDASGPEVLELLMEQHGLGSADLTELGSAQSVRAVLAGERDLHLGEVRMLAERFQVSPAVFV